MCSCFEVGIEVLGEHNSVNQDSQHVYAVTSSKCYLCYHVRVTKTKQGSSVPLVPQML